MDKKENLQFWKLIQACAKTRSLLKAGLLLGMDVSVCSKYISAFEAEEGIKLLDRRTRPAGFTENLDLLVPAANQIVAGRESADQILEEIRHDAEEREKHKRLIRISLPLNVRNPNVLRALISQMNSSGSYRIEFFADAGLHGLLENKVDIGQYGFNPHHPKVFARYVRTNGFLMLASRKFELLHGLPKTIEDLANFPVALRNPGNRSFKRCFENGIRKHYLPDGPNLIYGDTETCRMLLVEGEAISLDVSIGAVLRELKAGELIPVLPEWKRKANDTYVCCRIQDSEDPVIQSLMETIRKALASEEEDLWNVWAEKFGFSKFLMQSAL